LIKNVEDSRASLDRFVEFEMELRRVFKNDAFGEVVLQLGPGIMQHGHVAVRFFVLADDADVNVGVLQIRRGIDLLNRDELRLELALARDQLAKLPPDQLVYACETMLHGMMTDGGMMFARAARPPRGEVAGRSSSRRFRQSFCGTFSSV
jgi:hypothetical protein